MSILFVMSTLGLISLQNMRTKSVNALIDSTKTNVLNILNEKVHIADIEILIYKSYIEKQVNFIHRLYMNPKISKNVDVLPPNKNLKGEYSMQRFLLDSSMKYSDVANEVKLLSSLENYWTPMMENEGEIITSVYASTVNGAMVAYDKYSDLGKNEPNEESYFDFTKRAWYQNAINKKGVVFSNLTQDYYGKGLTLTCSSPFYDSKGNIAGVVGMDFLVTDLKEAMININLGESAYAFLVNSEGDIFASPFVELTQTEFENIKDKNSIYYSIYDKILNTNGGIDLLDNGIYCAYQPINVVDWKLCIRIPESLILKR